MTTSDAAPPRRTPWPALIGLVVSVLLLFWAVHKVEPARVLAHLRAADPALVVLAVAIATATFAIRALRWRWFLLDDRGAPLPFRPLWHAVAVGFMANNVLPLRAGELVRIFMITRLAPVRFPSALGSVAVERVFDGLTVLTLLFAALVTAPFPPDVEIGGVSLRHAAAAAAALAGAALIAASLVVTFPLAAERVVRLLVPAPGLAARLIGIIEGVRQGLSVLRSPTRLVLVSLLSAALWMVNAISFWVAFRAFDIDLGYGAALLLQGVLVLGITLPSTPGFVGVFEAAIVAALALYGIPNDRAVAYAATYHVTTFLPIVLLGFWSLSRTSIRFGELKQSAA